MAQKITLKDLAQALNVSVVTVSKALRDHPDISAKMKTQVKKTAKEMGYIPNIVARNLSSRRTRTIGLIVPKIAHSFFSSLIESVYQYAAEQNYEIVLTTSQENPEFENKHLLTMISMRVDGILISVTDKTDTLPLLSVVRENQIPLVQIDRTLNAPFSKVVFEDAAGTYRAVKHAIDLGYRKLAFVGGNHKLHIARDRLNGFKKALKESNLPVQKRFLVQGGFTEADGYRAVMDFKKSKQLPEFIFAATYPVALGVIKAAKELNLKIPEDIDLISFGGSEFNTFITPAISFVEQDTKEMARLAVGQVLREIEANEPGPPVDLRIPSELRLKETCVKRKGA